MRHKFTAENTTETFYGTHYNSDYVQRRIICSCGFKSEPFTYDGSEKQDDKIVLNHTLDVLAKQAGIQFIDGIAP